MGAILDNTPRSQKAVVTTFLKGFDPLGSVVGECAAGLIPSRDGQTGQRHYPSPRIGPLVLLSRYRDNVYIILVGIPPKFNAAVKWCIFCLLNVGYGIPMKWEKHSSMVI